jgi:hypothetical protein
VPYGVFNARGEIAPRLKEPVATRAERTGGIVVEAALTSASPEGENTPDKPNKAAPGQERYAGLHYTGLYPHSPVQLSIVPLRFTFRARDPVWFPPGKAANVFRGALGTILRRIACDPHCVGAADCPIAKDCAYARMFEPRAHGSGPSGFEDQPRPFVLWAASLNGRRFEAGERFTLEVNIFDPDAPAFECLRLAFVELGSDGLGPGRARVELIDSQKLPPVRVNLAPGEDEALKVRVWFLTPTELKSGGAILREPRFDVLLARARDRVSALCSLYQDALPGLDYRGMGQRAAAVKMTSARVEKVEFERRSGRTGQRHGIGGFVGEAEYEGQLAEFVPWLEAAEWVGVGRLTVWGNGRLKISR